MSAHDTYTDTHEHAVYVLWTLHTEAGSAPDYRTVADTLRRAARLALAIAEAEEYADGTHRLAFGGPSYTGATRVLTNALAR